MNSHPSPTPSDAPPDRRTPVRHRVSAWLAGAALLAALGSPALLPFAQAAQADLANTPLGVTTSNGKPNIMFIMDDSGSMAWDWMPDTLGYWNGWDWVPQSGKYGYRASQCNGVAYNPATTYLPPVDKDGVAYANASYTAAWVDGYDTGKGTINLSTASTGERYYYRYTGTQTPLSWSYGSDGWENASTTFYQECMSNIGSSPGSSRFVQVDTTGLAATGTVADPNSKQNYANWYSYYRTRSLAMRTSAGRAFVGLDSNYRIGYTRINDNSITGSDFLDVSDFDPTQKASFFNLLYSSPTSGGTPLRESLAKVGRYYGKAISGQTYDPMVNSATDSTLNSCRRNYALLSTDGYWNNGTGKRLDGTTDVGSQDSDEARPMKDSGSSTTTTTTDTTTVERRQQTGSSSYTITYERVKSVIVSAGCFLQNTRTSTTERRVDTVTAPYTQQTDHTTGSRRTVIVTNGVQTSDTTAALAASSSAVSGYPTYGSSSTATGSWSTVSTSTSCTSTGTGTSYSPNTSGNVTATSGTTFTPSGAYTVISTTGPTTGASVSNTTTTDGDSDSLADVAEYYYKTDLRTDIPNGNIRVLAGSRDTATWQHMTTFTLGLGVKGVLTYDPDYLTQTSGDYVDLKNGTKQWPVPAGTEGGSENATHVDDLWHAAVNGRGQYFSAQNPLDVTSGITTALNTIGKENGTGSAAAASNLMPVQGGEDLVFMPSFKVATWSGDLRAYHFSYDGSGALTGVNTNDGQELWSAKAKLDAQSSRTVYFNKAGTLTAFTYANLPTGALKTSFDNRCTSGVMYAQCGSITATAKAKVTGTNIVSYLAGDRSLEMSAASADNRVFRRRDARLGDLVNATPVYVAGPPFRYADAGYATYANSKAARKRVVYAAANDGMLHAFATGTSASNANPDSTGGTELWAFVPTAVMGEMWRLADTAYDNDHRYFVDATPVVGDVYDGTNWRTILVGGLGKGGKSYYALDITNPDAPTVLWEISSSTTGFANLGLSYGNPLITKLKDGTWTVIFSSGVNNVGDGVGRVYVVNAVTGAKLSEVSTGAGGTTTPSNLVRLNAWIDSDTNNTALRLYGGDMLGNFWRFDHDNNLAPTGAEATLMGIAQNPSSGVQPITVKPVLVEVTISGVKKALITFGTGRYLGTTDLPDTGVQSIYVLKDELGAITSPATSLFGVLRSTGAQLVKQSMNTTHDITTPSTVDWSTKNGWFVDLDQSARERIAIDPASVQGSTVSYASTIPDGSVCPAGGQSYLYDFDLYAGTFTKAAESSKLIVGLGRFIANANSPTLRKVGTLLTYDDQSAGVVKRNALTAGVGTTVKRSAWREIVD